MDLSDDASDAPATSNSAASGTAMASARASELAWNRFRQRSGGDLSASRFPLGDQLPKHPHQPTAGLERSVTQHGEPLGGDP
jgi:hypothetical protein